MPIQNAMLLGGAVLSLTAGALAGQYALLPTRADHQAGEMTPLRLGAWTAPRRAQWAPPPVAPPPTVEKLAVAQDVSVPPGEPDLPSPTEDAAAAPAHDTAPTTDQTSGDAKPPPAIEPGSSPADPLRDAAPVVPSTTTLG